MRNEPEKKTCSNLNLNSLIWALVESTLPLLTSQCLSLTETLYFPQQWSVMGMANVIRVWFQTMCERFGGEKERTNTEQLRVGDSDVDGSGWEQLQPAHNPVWPVLKPWPFQPRPETRSCWLILTGRRKTGWFSWGYTKPPLRPALRWGKWIVWSQKCLTVISVQLKEPLWDSLICDFPAADGMSRHLYPLYAPWAVWADEVTDGCRKLWLQDEQIGWHGWGKRGKRVSINPNQRNGQLLERQRAAKS